jgi:hypothetical protein
VSLRSLSCHFTFRLRPTTVLLLIGPRFARAVSLSVTARTVRMFSWKPVEPCCSRSILPPMPLSGAAVASTQHLSSRRACAILRHLGSHRPVLSATRSYIFQPFTSLICLLVLVPYQLRVKPATGRVASLHTHDRETWSSPVTRSAWSNTASFHAGPRRAPRAETPVLAAPVRHGLVVGAQTASSPEAHPDP